jgi:hypothetical protein
VTCAKRVFGYEKDIKLVELKPGDNQLSSNSEENIQYYKFGSEMKTTEAYSFSINVNFEKAAIFYDYMNCKGRKKISETPNAENNCGIFENTKNSEFIVFEPNGPIFISMNFKGKATIKITSITVKEVFEKGGSIKYDNLSYRNFSYKSTTPGYILAAASTKSAAGSISLFHDTKGCKSDTTYPRPEKHCLRKEGKNTAQLVIPNKDTNPRTHYFGLMVGHLNTVQFIYEFFGITEIGEGKHEFDFDNSHAKPFKYNAKVGKHTVTVYVSNDVVNKCKIYLDYAGCRIGSTVLPNMHDNCLVNTMRTEKLCSLNFELFEDVVVYFGVETIISEQMTVEISTGKLIFLE